ncbi:hypothetical protein AB0O47_32695 [Streptomyces noursei]|uniref:hypothetical protein n=1 Tax=Streptomyces noursei TaxID=1971 RepID=UPI00344FAB5B
MDTTEWTEISTDLLRNISRPGAEGRCSVLIALLLQPGQSATMEDLAGTTGLDTDAIAAVIDQFVQDGFVYTFAGEPGFVLDPNLAFTTTASTVSL